MVCEDKVSVVRTQDTAQALCEHFNDFRFIFLIYLLLYQVVISLEGLERYTEYLFKADGPLGFESIKKGFNLLRFVRSLSDGLKEKIDSLPNIIQKNFPPPKVCNFFVTVFFYFAKFLFF